MTTTQTTQNLATLTDEQYADGLQLISRIRAAESAVYGFKTTVMSAEQAKSLADERRFMRLRYAANSPERILYEEHIAPFEAFMEQNITWYNQ